MRCALLTFTILEHKLLLSVVLCSCNEPERQLGPLKQARKMLSVVSVMNYTYATCRFHGLMDVTLKSL